MTSVRHRPGRSGRERRQRTRRRRRTTDGPHPPRLTTDGPPDDWPRQTCGREHMGEKANECCGRATEVLVNMAMRALYKKSACTSVKMQFEHALSIRGTAACTEAVRIRQEARGRTKRPPIQVHRIQSESLEGPTKGPRSEKDDYTLVVTAAP